MFLSLLTKKIDVFIFFTFFNFFFTFLWEKSLISPSNIRPLSLRRNRSARAQHIHAGRCELASSPGRREGAPLPLAGRFSKNPPELRARTSPSLIGARGSLALSPSLFPSCLVLSASAGSRVVYPLSTFGAEPRSWRCALARRERSSKIRKFECEKIVKMKKMWEKSGNEKIKKKKKMKKLGNS